MSIMCWLLKGRVVADVHDLARALTEAGEKRAAELVRSLDTPQNREQIRRGRL